MPPSSRRIRERSWRLDTTDPAEVFAVLRLSQACFNRQASDLQRDSLLFSLPDSRQLLIWETPGNSYAEEPVIGGIGNPKTAGYVELQVIQKEIRESAIH